MKFQSNCQKLSQTIFHHAQLTWKEWRLLVTNKIDVSTITKYNAQLWVRIGYPLFSPYERHCSVEIVFWLSTKLPSITPCQDILTMMKNSDNTNCNVCVSRKGVKSDNDFVPALRNNDRQFWSIKLPYWPSNCHSNYSNFHARNFLQYILL